MRKSSVVQNPVVLSVPVRYRNAKGQYTKPHLARYVEYKPPGARKVRLFELSKGRKTKAQVEALTRELIREIVREREAARIRREEARRARLPKARRGVLPDTGKVKKSRREVELYSKSMQQDIVMVGHNFEFSNKVPIFVGNFDILTEFLKGMVMEAALRILNKEKAWGNRVYIKIFGDGFYKRKTFRGERGQAKVVADRLGFSLNRAILLKPEHLEDHVNETFLSMRSAFFGTSRSPGYFAKKVDQNEYFITGFRIEYVKV